MIDIIDFYRMSFGPSPGILEFALYWMSNKGRVKRYKNKRRKK
jgi:hypothetical protein